MANAPAYLAKKKSSRARRRRGSVQTRTVEVCVLIEQGGLGGGYRYLPMVSLASAEITTITAEAIGSRPVFLFLGKRGRGLGHAANRTIFDLPAGGSILQNPFACFCVTAL
jgi:hypothetical protein